MKPNRSPPRVSEGVTSMPTSSLAGVGRMPFVPLSLRTNINVALLLKLHNPHDATLREVK